MPNQKPASATVTAPNAVAEPPTPPADWPFARYVSSVEGHLVSRYGTGTRTQSPSIIGARRDPVKTADVTWLPDVVVPLTAREARAFRREYDRAIADGALVERSYADYLAWLERANQEDERAIAAAEAKAKDTSDAAKDARAEELATTVQTLNDNPTDAPGV